MPLTRSTPTAPPTSELIASFHARIRDMDPTIQRDSPAYNAAMLLLALKALPPQIDHLARWLGLQREFVARCIRRLVDNGVLQSDGLVGSWVEGERMEEAFWADVKVARGLWQRRHDARGNLEWVEAGVWQKPYDYLTPEVPDTSTRYIAGEGRKPRLHIDGFAAWGPSMESLWIGGVRPDVAVRVGASQPVGASESDGIESGRPVASPDDRGDMGTTEIETVWLV